MKNDNKKNSNDMKRFIQFVLFVLVCWWIYANCIGSKEDKQEQPQQQKQVV